ncbi:SCO2583 family membrane protein [Streptomyces sp. SYSU K217416]
MAGPGDPPEGTPEGVPAGGEDEYRSVVFDESFVRAARLQEYSAQERITDHSPAVRSRPAWTGRRGPGQALALVLVIALAFGAAIYMGLRHPYAPLPAGRPEPLGMTVIPLEPEGPVPGGTPADLFERSPAAHFRVGAAGITLPAVRRTSHFSESQVVTALSTAKDYLVESSLDPDVLSGSTDRPVRVLLDPDQVAQFDRSLETPADDGRHAATGWLVRFDPAKVVPADPEVRVRGTMRYSEAGPDTIEVVTDHTFVYAVREAAAAPGRADGASLFTVRRELHLRFDRDDLRTHRAELHRSYVQAGPQACAADPAGRFQPLLAGQKATSEGPPGTDPYATTRATASLCGALAATAQPADQR